MIPQFTKLVAKVDFQMKLDGPGRACKVKIGDAFMVTNPKHTQDKGIKVMRAKTARLNEGYLLSCDQVNMLFNIAE